MCSSLFLLLISLALFSEGTLSISNSHSHLQSDPPEGILVKELEFQDQDASPWEKPEPPRNLRVKISQEGVASFTWEPPSLKTKGITGYKLAITQDPNPFDQLSNSADLMSSHSYMQPQPSEFSILTNNNLTTSFLLGEDQTYFTTHKLLPLIPGCQYGVTLQSEFHASLSIPLEANFTISPNPPDRFVVWYRNETSFLILWQPPNFGYFEGYKATLNPPESPLSTLLVSRWEYQFGPVRPGFYFLTPGKAYNVSVSTYSGDLESDPVVKEYRTMPLPPQGDLNVTLLRRNDKVYVQVEWEHPDEGEFDGFNIYIKREWRKPMQRFVPRGKPPVAILDDGGILEVGREYEVVVKTVSGKVSSHPKMEKFLYENVVIEGSESEGLEGQS